MIPEIKYTLFINDSPAAPDILEVLQGVEVENNGNMADVFRLRIAIGISEKGDWSVLEDDIFKPLTPVTIGMQVGTGPGENLIQGYVTSQSVKISNEPGQSFLEVVGMDATVLMNLEEKVVSWPNMSDSDIASAVFSDYGITPKVDQTQPTRDEKEVTTMQRGTDIQFLRQLAERNGFECYVENHPQSKKNIGHFHALGLEGKARGVLSMSLAANTNVNSFSARYEMLRPTTAQARDIDIFSGSVQKGEAQSVSINKLGQEGLLERITKPPLVFAGQTGLAKDGELQTVCQAVVDRSSWAVFVEGDLDTAAYKGILRAQSLVNVRGAGSMYDGTYYVTRVLHSFDGDEYTQHFELRRNAVKLSGSEDFVASDALA